LMDSWFFVNGCFIWMNVNWFDSLFVHSIWSDLIWFDLVWFLNLTWISSSLMCNLTLLIEKAREANKMKWNLGRYALTW
jgi:hypothetical protein